MCGISGFISTDIGTENALQILRKMNQTLNHRGPNDSGVWFDVKSGVGMAHARLAVVDLSSRGHQPMLSIENRYVISMNGEIYNFPELKDELEREGFRFEGKSDTEVFLGAITHWGFEHAVKKTIGMFAFALFDQKHRILHLCRDRMGEKTLYYGKLGATFVFGSELKPLLCFAGSGAHIDVDSLYLFLKFGYIPTPKTIYSEFFKIPPGTIVSISARNIALSNLPEPQKYWSIADVAARGVENFITDSEQEAVNELETKLGKSIARQLTADVPVGAFLSGGIDSSLVTTLIQTRQTMPLKTFTLGFPQADFDESDHALKIARHLGTDHTHAYVSADDVLKLAPNIHEFYDEPFADASQIPVMLISRLARKHVTVCLSGDGGDEIFGGYNRYTQMRTFLKLKTLFPAINKFTGDITRSISSSTWENILPYLAPFLPKALQHRYLAAKIQKGLDFLDAKNHIQFYLKAVTLWENPPMPMRQTSANLPQLWWENSRRQKLPDLIENLMLYDQVSYLPDDILVKLDRGTMSTSLETRLPYLDHEIVEYSWRLPPTMKIRGHHGKWILRRILEKHFPQGFFERAKTGFSFPLATWLRGPLKDWAESLLCEGSLNRYGFIAPGPVREKWIEHLEGKRDWSPQIWAILIFQSWFEKIRLK